MRRWSEFAIEAPEIARAGIRRLVAAEGAVVAMLGTVSAKGVPRLAPVCPIFCGRDVYLCVAAHTPKAADLRRRGRYALHALPGANDEEFQISGTAVAVLDIAERRAVHAAIPFKAFDVTDPLFRLPIERALWVYWENAGEPDTRAVRRAWRAGVGAA